MNETTLESIMQYSKEAIARAYLCRTSAYYEPCSLHAHDTENCPVRELWCSDVKPQDWEKVLNDRTGMAQRTFAAEEGGNAGAVET